MPVVFVPQRAEVYDRVVAEDLFSVLGKFHREVVLPDIERIIDARLGAHVSPFREEMRRHFDAIDKRFDRLESQYQALKSAVQRIEERLAAVEQKLDKMALRSELLDLKERVAALEQRIADIEADLG